MVGGCGGCAMGGCGCGCRGFFFLFAVVCGCGGSGWWLVAAMVGGCSDFGMGGRMWWSTVLG